jgi:hypothetical protein
MEQIFQKWQSTSTRIRLWKRRILSWFSREIPNKNLLESILKGAFFGVVLKQRLKQVCIMCFYSYPNWINQSCFCRKRSRRDLDYFPDPQIKYKRDHAPYNSNFCNCTKKSLKRRCSEFKNRQWVYACSYTLGLLHGRSWSVVCQS